MSDYKFVSTDTETLISSLVTAYEAIMGTSVQPGSPDKLYIDWVANVIVQERVLLNVTGNQNIPSRATGENLDALGELFYEQERPGASKATTTMLFTISAAQTTPVLIPAGTRVTDTSSTLFWETVEDVYIAAGATSATVSAECQTAGAAGNGYAIGQINTIVDAFIYFQSCTNTTVSANGSDEYTDEEYRELLKSSVNGYSCAGAKKSYEYFAKSVNKNIADVKAISPSAGTVKLYALMDDGTEASSEVKTAILNKCSADEVRPLTDSVSTGGITMDAYSINITYYMYKDTTKSASEYASEVATAVQSYIEWQCAKMGRDINPDKLRELVLATGVKRVVVTYPTYTVVADGSESPYVPHCAQLTGTATITSGGYEDE